MEYTYILKSKKDGKMYTGLTSDLRKRFKEHNEGLVPSTKNRGPFKIIYYEACVNRQDAASREIFLKTGMGKRYIKNRLKRFLSLTAQRDSASTVINSLPKSSEVFNGGYIALTSVIIVSLLLLTVITALSSVNYFSRYNILENEYKDRSFALAEGCVDYAIGRLAGNSNYIGNETVNIGVGTCQVASVSSGAFPKTISTVGIFPPTAAKKSYTKLQAVVSSSFAISSFIENP